jgi:glycosyltransferase involved in cell wall biosynthesis
MRLALVESAPRGGLLHYAAQLAAALGERGHDVQLITARGHELPGPLEHATVRAVLPAAISTPTEPPTGLRYQLRRAGILARLLRASLRTFREAMRGSYDFVVLVDDLSVTPAALGALALTLPRRGPLIAAVCHEPRPRSRRPGRDLYVGGTLARVLTRVYPRLDVVFVHGERSRREFEQAWPPAHASVIPHGDERLVASEPGPMPDEERILFFGEWRRAKGLHELMSAFDELVEHRSGARLTIAGTPTPDVDPNTVRAWARAHGERVTVIDHYVPLEDVPDLFSAARVVAAPYLAGSQSGVVHLAMTMGRPVVATDVGELPEAVVDGETGRIVPAADGAALARALEEVLRDPSLAARWGEAGRRRVIEEFGWERVAERVEARLLAEIVDNRP